MADRKSRRRAKRHAEERGLAALANDTKWTEFFREVEHRRIPLQIKLLYESEPYPYTRLWIPVDNYIDSPYGPELFVFVEWVKAALPSDVVHIAEAAGLEFALGGSEITVYGYK
jgi:hypothetical protein